MSTTAGPRIKARNVGADAPDDVDKPQDAIQRVQNESEPAEVDAESPVVTVKSQPASSALAVRPTILTNDANGDPRSRQTSDPAGSARYSPRPPPFDDIAIDPLSQHILKRTGTSNQLVKLKRQDTNDSTLGSTSLGDDSASSFKASGQSTPPLRRSDLSSVTKDKKKGVSFLSRFIGSKKKEPTVNEDDDSESIVGDQRTEAVDAPVFSQPIGFTPTYPPPPKYIRVRAHHKSLKDFNRVFLAQELFKDPTPPKDSQNGSPEDKSEATLPMAKHKSGAIWSMKFSKDGRYLAVAGQDKIVTVWEVLSSEDDRREHEIDEESHVDGNSTQNGHSNGGARLSAPVFRAEPLREYTGHTSDILALSWSKNNFLLSSSMDKTVRLWHVTRSECLCAFQHSDFVTSILFHPKDDRFFLAGSLDSKLRLWSIPDKNVAFSVELPDLITAVAFTPDGKYAIAGCLSGLCIFYETEGLRYHTQVHVRSSHGRNARGSKITGIEALSYPPDDPNGEIKLLITSNDSRIRLYNFRDKSLENKFRGHENTCSQIHATFSDDMKHIICGSEDRKVYIWDVNAGLGEKKTKIPVEYFEAHSSIVTCALVAPTKTRQLLGHSGDPIYDLCNPPPVTLISRSESFGSSIRFQREALVQETLMQRTRDPTSYPGEKVHTPKAKPAEESPAYVARSQHLDGHIMVTADLYGKIKVFRQDCAWLKRKNENWETSSTFSKKIGSGIFGNGANKRFSGYSQSPNPDRILSWRNSIQSQDGSRMPRNSMGGRESAGRDSAGRESAGRESAGRESAGRDSAGRESTDDKDTSVVSSRNRSVSPKKSVSTMSTQSYGTANSNVPKIAISDISGNGNGPVANRSRGNSVNSTASSTFNFRNKQSTGKDYVPTSPLAKTISNDPTDLLLADGGQSFAFYNLAAAPSTSVGHLMPDGSDRRPSIISSADTDDGFSSDTTDDNEALQCKKCGGTSFNAKKSNRRGEARLVCANCGMPC
ncbi:hypothetical protein TWF696_006282 [Orbilia brochopaga]|uniref:WD repeat-containing protein 44 n=1 Tax=Orbilia brochopaga TaxID=3140254 RepID=A0AAV9UWD7_9PEZI